MYIITEAKTGQYFSLFNGGMFTDNFELAQRFVSEVDAMFCVEQFIDGNEGFEKYGMIDTVIRPL